MWSAWPPCGLETFPSGPSRRWDKAVQTVQTTIPLSGPAASVWEVRRRGRHLPAHWERLRPQPRVCLREVLRQERRRGECLSALYHYNGRRLSLIMICLILSRDGGVCAVCGVSVSLARWHLVPLRLLSVSYQDFYFNVESKSQPRASIMSISTQ